jgi:excisionase family DNA binding protein
VPETDQQLLNIPEAAQHLRVQPSTVRKWLFQRRFTHHKVGRRVLIFRAVLDAFVAAGVIPAGVRPEKRKPKRQPKQPEG